MKKIIPLLIGIILSIGQYTYATIGNCQDISSISEYDIYANIYSRSLFTIARKNLKSYCCKYKFANIESTIEDCEKDKTDTYVESPRLYDHLVDVGMRYIDGEQTLQYPWAAIDKKWQEWRKIITDFWSNPNGGIPLDLRNKYVNRWGGGTQELNINYWMESCTKSKSRFERYNNERDTTLTLTQKYFIICELSSCIANNTKNTSIVSCRQMAQQRTQFESNYVQALLIQQWTMALQTNFNAYAIWYVTHEKFWQLLEKIMMMSRGLWFINDKVSEMTKTCSS